MKDRNTAVPAVPACRRLDGSGSLRSRRPQTQHRRGRLCSISAAAKPLFSFKRKPCGTSHTFDPAHNESWLPHTSPILESLFHAHYFLKVACQYAGAYETMPQLLPSGFAALLCLFDLR